jgi:hypothetical protein
MQFQHENMRAKSRTQEYRKGAYNGRFGSNLSRAYPWLYFILATGIQNKDFLTGENKQYS